MSQMPLDPYPDPALKDRQERSLRPRRLSQESGHSIGDNFETKSHYNLFNGTQFVLDACVDMEVLPKVPLDPHNAYPDPVLKERHERSIRLRRLSQESGHSKGDNLEAYSFIAMILK
jgi:hypothetical protein